MGDQVIVFSDADGLDWRVKQRRVGSPLFHQREDLLHHARAMPTAQAGLFHVKRHTLAGSILKSILGLLLKGIRLAKVQNRDPAVLQHLMDILQALGVVDDVQQAVQRQVEWVLGFSLGAWTAEVHFAWAVSSIFPACWLGATDRSRTSPARAVQGIWEVYLDMLRRVPFHVWEELHRF